MLQRVLREKFHLARVDIDVSNAKVNIFSDKCVPIKEIVSSLRSGGYLLKRVRLG